ncbi:acyltransferase domain-containing protein [Thermopolyspora sp. NPDC052614]|uniref:acyltransferase domain-containing protein n=1 Tax=Thermopolyspora sp. NPDC052614 TaxID=3155682 RepID=UPI0034313F93
MTARLLALSAPTPERLERATDELADRLEKMDEAEFAGLPPVPEPPAGPGPLRRAVAAETAAKAARWLRRRDPRRVFSGDAGAPASPVLLFSGVGDQYPGIGARLHRTVPAFRDALDHCVDVLAAEHGLDLRPFLAPPEAAARPGLAALFDQSLTPGEIHRTVVAQPLLFAVEYALGRALAALGVRPAALAGYSVGEYPAACLAGVMPLGHALRLTVERARLVDRLPEGAMLAVAAGPEALRPYLGGPLSLAALNGPGQTVLSGPVAAVEDAARRLAGRDVACRRLATSHAFHSAMLEPLVPALEELLRAVPLRPPAVPLLSNVTGTWVRAEQATSPAYWARHLCRTIRFGDEVAEIWRLPAPLLVEVGPGQALTRLALAHPDRPADAWAAAVPTLPGRFESRTEREPLLVAAGRLWAAGARIDWHALGEEDG